MRTHVAEGPVLSGDIPSVTGAYVSREVSGLTLGGLPADQTTVLLPAEDAASDPGWRGGTGKTSLASAIARACWENRMARLVAWITVTGRDSVLSGYARALEELGLVRLAGQRAEHVAGLFLEWLAKADQPWLVVFDDLADPAVLDGLWPAGSAGRVLVTAPRADAMVPPGPRLVPVGAFSPREALDYLSAILRVDPGQRAGALDLADDLGFRPLALSLAGAFIARTGLDCRQYRALFAERRQPLALAFPDDIGSAVAATWSLARELADQAPPRGLAGQVLILISMLAPQGIPGAVLTSDAARSFVAGREGTQVEVGEVVAALRNLVSTGLVVVDDRNPARTVRVHEMIQAITRQHLHAAEYRRAVQAAADALAQAWPGGYVAPPVAQALRDCAAEVHQIGGTLLWTPQCHPALLRAGQSLDAEGLSDPAVAYWQAMLGISQQVLGAEDPQTINIRDFVSSAAEASGHLDDAIAIYEAMLRDTERALGPGHPDTLLACERLTRCYVAAGRTDEAVRLTEQVLISCRQSLGADHAETLAVHANLSSLYLRAGRVDEARGAFEQVLARREQVLGQAHPDTIATRASLASTYQQAGRFKEAIALGKRVLEDRERLQGAGHLDTVSARASLAAAYRDAKKLKDALRLYERVLADRERLQGADHPDTIVARTDLALVNLSMRKLAIAIEQYERAEADAERVLGHMHSITQAVRQNVEEAATYARSVVGIDLRSRHS
jgi:tetratricopeptide (TPR) repeat protein